MAKMYFSNVKFYLIGLKESDIEEKLLANGAQKEHYLSDIVTHCIANNCDDEVAEARDLYQLKVVNIKWVNYSVQCQTPLPTKPFEIEASEGIFRGLVFCLLELSIKDSELLWGLVMLHGGKIVGAVSCKVTHLVTNSSQKSLPASLNLPHYIINSTWILESIASKTKLPEADYHPSLFEVVIEKESVEEKVVVETRTRDPNGRPSIEIKNNNKSIACSKESFWLSKGIFSKCVFHVEDYRRRVGDEEMLLWRQLIREEGGRVVDAYSLEVTHVLCMHQHTQHFAKGREDKKEMRTAYWLNDCLVSKHLLQPFAFLHLPYPPSISRTLARHVVSTSNLKGLEKVLLKRTILLLGAEYTADLSRRNTMLIFKTGDSKKLSMAHLWNIPTITIASFYQYIQPSFLFSEHDDNLSTE